MHEVPQGGMSARGNEKEREKDRVRARIALLYKIEHWAARIVLLCALCSVLVVLVGICLSWNAIGSFLLYQTLPWPYILIALVILGFAFIFSDSSIQGYEERWFMRFGTEVQAEVVGSEPLQTWRRWRWLRWLLGDVEEVLLKLDWQQPESGQLYHYEKRVRDSKLPRLHARIPVIIDYDDPAYFFKEDYKDPSVKFFA